MDTPALSAVTNPGLRAALDAIAAAPQPAYGPDPAEAAIRLLAPDARTADLAPLREHVAQARQRFQAQMADRSAVPGRLAALRRELAERGLAGMLVPHSDEYLGEYIALRSQRLTWLTGFAGSAGLAVVMADKATVLVDGRYVLQVRQQVDGNLFEYRHITDQPATDWVTANLPANGRLAYDPWHFTERRLEGFRAACVKAGGELVALDTNPIDTVWHDQPPPPLSPIVPHDVKFAGEESDAKRARIAKTLKDGGAAAAVLTAPDSIAWLLNVRGNDVPNTPLPLSFAILFDDGRVDWFVDPRKLAPETHAHVGEHVRVRPIGEFGVGLDGLDGLKVRADANATAAWVIDRLTAAKAMIQRERDPCQLPKACKNTVELAGTRAAHVRDGVALAKFLAWIAKEGPRGGLDELAAADRLAKLRAAGQHFRGLSFDSISGAGPNGAVVHYRVTEETNRSIEPGSIYLIDSGGQYLDGTTDVTRAVAIGEPTAEMRDRFTRVLKGHIQLALAKFPPGTSGPQLDVLARMPLWQAGIDFDHGTGHGVGSYLGVHEGPQGISARAEATPLKPGMIVSNEPGYYKQGAFGIRIENLVVVMPATAPTGSEKELLGFETITLAPIDRALIDPRLLSAEEKGWLNAYHARVRETVGPLVDAATREWLNSATAGIA